MLCLAAELWLEWINDEIPLTGLFPESVLELRVLFESAVEDYLCKETQRV